MFQNTYFEEHLRTAASFILKIAIVLEAVNFFQSYETLYFSLTYGNDKRIIL